MLQPSAPLDVRVVSDERGFDALEQTWLLLQEASPDSSIFLSWNWQRLWWKHYGAERRLRIVVVSDGARVVGLLPLYVESQRKLGGLLEARKLRQIGVGGDTAPDDLGALLLPGFESLAVARMIHFLARQCPDWNMLDWSDLPAESTLGSALAEGLAQAGLRTSCSWSEPISYGDLPSTWDAYRSSLSRNRRETMGRKRRKFEAQAGAGLRVIDSPQALDAGFEQLARLHQLRWTGRTERPGFSTAQYRGFHLELMHALLRQGQLHLLALEMEGRTIAMLYGMQYKKRFCFFQSGFDPAYAAFSPGDVLMGLAVEFAILQGCTVFDMLKGDHDYKRHFVQQERRNLEVRAFRPGIVDLAYRFQQALGRGGASSTQAPHA